MKVIVGLGNPGEKYAKNRHNVGFIILDKWVEDRGLQWKFEKKFNAEVASEGEVLFVKPQTFMNSSGEAVSKILNFYKIPPENLLVVHDDVDLQIGATKRQIGRGSAGHKGVESIIEDALGTPQFWRLRVGVGKSPDPKIITDDWVLMDLSEQEIKNLHTLSY